MAYDKFYPTNIENRCTQNTRLIEYFPIVLMQLCELYIYEIDININCRHLFLICHIFYEIADSDFIDCILE